ncbi:Dexh-box atp-dependent rna helicase dexh12 [Thalictrum thalictroides]|uniref:RNA helicase n=1 Tax=Thalictrum thalictroides TaxID=46969 RepID=A0A7J6VF50_THATH|nr:Dexh-box atp-dependent rna helicase dexh12 [Thalictrum thalictroides]
MRMEEEDCRGGAESHARSKQFDYKSNSNLVLNVDHRSRDTYEPTGEAVSLVGKIDLKKNIMGDRDYKGRPSELNRLKKNKKGIEFECRGGDRKRRRVLEESVLNWIVEEDGGVYKPKTRETRAAYEALLSVIQQQLGGQRQDVVYAACDEVLRLVVIARLITDFCDEGARANVEENYVYDDVGVVVEFDEDEEEEESECDQLVVIARLITDFCDEGARANVEENYVYDDVGVVVEFDEDEEEEESECDQVLEEEEEEGVDGIDYCEYGGGDIGDDEVMKDVNIDEGTVLNVQEIDAYWLQRQISDTFKENDPENNHKIAEEVLHILAGGDDDREVERQLVVLLEYDRFSLVKFLLRNRLKIVWCTRLARAEDQEERKKIEEQMVGIGPNLAAILEQLHATRETAMVRQKNLEKSMRDEARRLNDKSGGDPKSCRNIFVNKEEENGWSKGQRQLLELECLAHWQGDLREIKNPALPTGSFKKLLKGYEEVHVPALKPKPLDPGEELIKISVMPDWAQPAFKGMTHLNRVQSKVYETALFTAENLLLCAPTGAGKTNVAMLTILQQIALNRNPDGTYNNNGYKIVYVAPMKALVAEVVGNLSNRLQHYNVKVSELSGDHTLTHQQIQETQIIVTTPEKWDIITRKSGDRTYTQLVKLLIIDEIHLLHDNRGPVLESIVARTVRQIEATKEHIRLVGLSATLPNYEDVALFLRVDQERGLFYFDNSYRPCPLAQQYIGIKAKKPLERKETNKTTCAIRDNALVNDTLGCFLKEDSASREILQSHIKLVKSNELKELLPYGFAIHHAGMGRADRQLVEDLFADGHVQVLVSTATLAWGVNLPAHTVIIKGTQIYNPDRGAWTELSPLIEGHRGSTGLMLFQSCGTTFQLISYIIEHIGVVPRSNTIAFDEDVPLFALGLINSELKLPLEAFLSCVVLRLAQSRLGASYQQQEVAMEALVDFCRQKTFMVEIYANLDCDIICSNVFEDLANLLSKSAFPV